MRFVMVSFGMLVLLGCQPSRTMPKQRPAGEDDCEHCQDVAQKAFDDCIKACGNVDPETCCLGDGCCTKCGGLTGEQGNAFNRCCTEPGRDCMGDPNGCVDPPPNNDPCQDTAAHRK